MKVDFSEDSWGGAQKTLACWDRTATKKGGTLLVHGYTPEQINFATGGPKDVTQMYTKETFEDAFDDVEIIVNHEYQMHISEGTGHNGQSALIDFVAKF